MRKPIIAAAAASLPFAAAPAAAQKIDFILNWVPGGDHAPYYYAKKLGWYQKEGIDLNLEPGKAWHSRRRRWARARIRSASPTWAACWSPRARVRTRWRCSTFTRIRRKACTG